MTVLVIGHLQTRPGDVDRLRPALVRHTRVVRRLEGCLDYVIGSDIDTPGCLRVVERWRGPTQAAHLIGGHMPAFNIAMQTASVLGAQLDAFEGSTVTRILEIPAKSFRATYDVPDATHDFVTVRLKRSAIAALLPRLCARIAAARAMPGCDLYAIARDATDDTLFVIVERWRDVAAQGAFRASTDAAAFDAVIAGASAGPVELWWRRLRGKVAANPR